MPPAPAPPPARTRTRSRMTQERTYARTPPPLERNTADYAVPSASSATMADGVVGCVVPIQRDASSWPGAQGAAAATCAWWTRLAVHWRIGRGRPKEVVPSGLEPEGQLRGDVLVRVDVPVQPVVRPRRDVRLLPCDARVPRARGRGRRHRCRRAERGRDHRHPEGDDRRELAARDAHRRAGER